MATAPVASERLDPNRMLHVLTQYKRGDFTARMPVNRSGIAAKVCDTLNEIIDQNQRLTAEIQRIGTVVIKNAAFAQRQSIEDILDVSRIINGRMALNMSSVDIRGVVDGALDTLRPAAEAKQIAVTTEIADAPETCGDRDRLQQVVWNLLSNAIKFTPREGRVAVRVDTLGTDVRIVVADNGQGIAPAFLPHIFDRFSQADSTVTRAHGGLGLGMSIVRHLVELHGGTVQAESEGEDRGATLTVTLPIRVYTPPSNRCRGRRPSGTFRGGSCHGWTASGCSWSTTSSIVSDLAMPVTDGYEMMRQVRKGSGRFVPAVALTAGVAPEDVTAAFAAGYQKHLPKPVSAAALVRTAAELAPCRRLSEAPADNLTPHR